MTRASYWFPKFATPPWTVALRTALTRGSRRLHGGGPQDPNRPRSRPRATPPARRWAAFSPSIAALAVCALWPCAFSPTVLSRDPPPLRTLRLCVEPDTRRGA